MLSSLSLALWMRCLLLCVLTIWFFLPCCGAFFPSFFFVSVGCFFRLEFVATSFSQRQFTRVSSRHAHAHTYSVASHHTWSPVSIVRSSRISVALCSSALKRTEFITIIRCAQFMLTQIGEIWGCEQAAHNWLMLWRLLLQLPVSYGGAFIVRWYWSKDSRHPK